MYASTAATSKEDGGPGDAEAAGGAVPAVGLSRQSTESAASASKTATFARWECTSRPECAPALVHIGTVVRGRGERASRAGATLDEERKAPLRSEDETCRVDRGGLCRAAMRRGRLLGELRGHGRVQEPAKRRAVQRLLPATRRDGRARERLLYLSRRELTRARLAKRAIAGATWTRRAAPGRTRARAPRRRALCRAAYRPRVRPSRRRGSRSAGATRCSPGGVRSSCVLGGAARACLRHRS